MHLRKQWVCDKGFPLFDNVLILKTIHTKVCNYQWDLNYGHVSSDLSSDKLTEWWKIASAEPSDQRYNNTLTV